MKRMIGNDAEALQGAGGALGGEAAAVPEAARRPLRELMDDRLLDALLERSRDQAGGLRLTGEGSMLGELVRAVLERALESELTAHLGYEKGGRGGAGGGNARNGNIAKTVQTGVGPVPLQVPRDRAGTFEPVLVPKRSGRVAGGLDDMVISLYAHGMSVRDIIHHLRQLALGDAGGLVGALAGSLAAGGALAGPLVLDVVGGEPRELDGGVVGREVSAGLGGPAALVVQGFDAYLELWRRPGLWPAASPRGAAEGALAA
jgi:hypothetical protein